MPTPERVDDPTITDEEVLWRRIHPDHVKPKEGRESISSAAFKEQALSVHIASLTTRETVLSRYPQHRLAAFAAGDARRGGYIVVRDPTEEDRSHALVLPQETLTCNAFERQARRLRDLARLI